MEGKPISRNILVTGGGGYLGSMLVPLLLENRHCVHVLDRLYFGDEALGLVKNNQRLRITRENLLEQENISDLMYDVNLVIHLASISNDPSCDLDPNLSISTNFLATMALARRAKTEGVKQFIFISSCSVYGASEDRWLDETSPTGPVTLYALTKLEGERELLKLSSDGFRVTVLRLATLFGLSPRMRFDLAVNTMAKRALQGKNIIVSGTGSQWRPFLHVRDAAEAIIGVFEAPPSSTQGEIFNVGNDDLNYRIADLAREIQSALPGTRIDTIAENKDIRSYRVNFKKIREMLGLVPERTILDGVTEIANAYGQNLLGDMDHEQFYNLLVMKKSPQVSIVTPSLASAPRWASVINLPGPASQAAAEVPQDRHEMSGAKTHKEPYLVAMILAYNCGRLLPKAYDKIPKNLVQDIFVTDDGSIDGTFEVAQQLGLKAYRHTPNRGYGGNVKAGLKRAMELGADYVVEIHGDGAQFDPSAVAQAMPDILSGADFILGSRFQNPKRARENGMPLIRFWANRFLSFFDRLVLGLPFTEFHSGFRVYSRKMLETIPFGANSEDYLFSFQIIAQAAYYKMQIAEVPVEADYLNEHTSHKLSGATVYALQTFIILGSYLLAKAGLRYSRVFLPIHQEKKQNDPERSNAL